MPNLKVTLVRLCKTPGGWKRYGAAFDANGGVKPNRVIEHGREKEYPTGRYQIRYYDGRRTKYENVGIDPEKAGEALQIKSKSLEEQASSNHYREIGDFPMQELAVISRSPRRSQNEIQPEQGTLTLPHSLMKRVAEEAIKNRSTINEWVCMVVAQRIGAIDAGRV